MLSRRFLTASIVALCAATPVDVVAQTSTGSGWAFLCPDGKPPAASGNCRRGGGTTGSQPGPSAPAAPAVDLRRVVNFSHVDARGDVAIHLPDGAVLRGSAITSRGIPAGARVITGPDAGLSVRLASGINLRVGAGSEVTIDALLRDPSQNSLESASVGLTRGLLQWATEIGHQLQGAYSEHDRFHVRTPNAVLAVRGTDVEVFFDIETGGHIKLRSGEVAVWPVDSGEEIILRPGQMLKFDKDFLMTGPIPID